MYFTGYIVARGYPLDEAIESEYVFRTVAHTELWKDLRQISGTIKRVASLKPFNWTTPLMGSAVGQQDIEFADHLYTIYPDHRYAPGEYRAHIYEGGSF